MASNKTVYAKPRAEVLPTPKEYHSFTLIALLIASSILVFVSFIVGFGGTVMIMSPDTVFGPDRQGTHLVGVALGIGGILEFIAIWAFANVASRFEPRSSSLR